jgi:Domain of unknown function (DUF4389)
MTSVLGYPVHVEASLDRPLSRWLWLVKWLLAIPHYVIVGLLWIAFAVLSVVAFVAILITGRYPRSIFDFNVGVLRWTWRVQYYTFGALATDRYPPFSLGDVPDYPARLVIDYPQRLSRGLVLVKWWLLAIPHYLIIGIFLGGGVWLGWRADANESANWGPGLIGIVVLIAGVMLAVTGSYPRELYDFVLGMDRWVLRVAAYAGLMTDRYPPFRFDMGGQEAGGTLVVPPPTASAGSAAPVSAASTRPAGPQWTGPRIASVVIGSVLALAGLGALGAGGAALWLDQRRDGGYVTSDLSTQRTAGYAVTSDRVELDVPASGWQWTRDLLGTVRIRVTGTGSEAGTFVGIAPTDRADQYLAGVPHTVLTDLAGRDATIVDGSAVPAAPQTVGIWVAQSTGSGERTLIWEPTAGNWTVVVMNADAAPGLTVRGDVGATLPALTGIAIGLLTGGAILLAGGVLLVALAANRATARGAA